MTISVPFTFLFPLFSGTNVTEMTFGVKTRSYITRDHSSNSFLGPNASSTRSSWSEGTLIIMEGQILDMMDVYDDLSAHWMEMEYDISDDGLRPIQRRRSFVNRYQTEWGPYGVHKVIQGARTESVPLGVNLKILASLRALKFDEHILLSYTCDG